MGETKELIELADLCVGVVKAAQAVTADGKVGLDDLPALLKIVPLVSPAVEGVSLVPQELKDLSEEDAVAVVAHVATELALPDGKAKLVVEKSLSLLVAGLGLAKALQS